MATTKLKSRPDAIPTLVVKPVSPALCDAVDAFWLKRMEAEDPSLVPRTSGRTKVVLGPSGVADESAPGYPQMFRHQLVVPDGSLDILVKLPYRVKPGDAAAADEGNSYACVLMPIRHTVDAAFATPSNILGIRFFAGGARDFFSMSVHELGDRAIPLEELWGSAARTFADETAQAATISEMAIVAEKHLLMNMREPSSSTALVRRCVRALEESGGRLSLEELQDISGRTQRQLERLFKEYVGMSPKRFTRTLRLNYLLKAVRNLDAVDWHDLVLALNYCDQPHLIREFRDFIGMSPASFRDEMRKHLAKKKRLGKRSADDDL